MHDTASSTLSPMPSTPLSLTLPPSARAVLGLLERLAHGSLELRLPDGSLRRYGPGRSDAPHAVMHWPNWNVCAAVLRSGDIGLAESYIAGDWHSPDVSALLRLLIANRDALEKTVYGSWWGALAYRLRHAFNRNSRSGSRRNIHAHYDLGNAFYRLWLDEGMSYSSAWFDGRPEQSLADAQHAKMNRALREVRLKTGDRLLEIGCGWGGLAQTAAWGFGAHVTGVTLSTEQLAWAQERIQGSGLRERVDLRLQDYRDLDEPPFDAVVSIEMFEAVGRRYWPDYFAAVARLLKPGGRACIQSITIRDDLFERYARSTDFIQQYIFPGGMLPSVSEFHRAASQAGLVVKNQLSFGPDYAETLRRWRERFHAEAPRMPALGFDSRFMRTWSFYLHYCEAAFDTGNTDVVQFTLEKP